MGSLCPLEHQFFRAQESGEFHSQQYSRIAFIAILRHNLSGNWQENRVNPLTRGYTAAHYHGDIM
jgi:hypothetical protein